MKKALVGTRVHSANEGFTLLELMAAISITVILAAIATPNMRDFIWNSRLTGDANNILRALQTARSEALKRQSNVTVCISANPTAGTAATCSFGAGTGWIVFQDTNADWQHQNGETLFSTQSFSTGVTVRSDNSAVLTYDRNGFRVPNASGGQTPSRNVVLFDTRGNQQIGGNSTARALLITGTGRPRVSRSYSELQTACGDVGLSNNCS